MPIARFQMPDGRVARFEVPEGTSPEQAQSMMEAHFAAPEQPKAAAPAGEIPVGRQQRGFFESIGAPIEAVAQGVISGGGNVMFGGQRLLGKGLSALGATDTGAFLQEDAARRLAESQAAVAPFKKEFPIFTGAGELGAEIIGTAPVGGAIAAPLKAIPAAAPLAQAIRTGGFSTGRAVQGAPFAARAGDIALRAAGGGALGGATSAVINPEEAGTGALFGAALPVAAPLIGKAVSKVADFSKLPEQRATRLAKQAIGNDLPEVVNALRTAPPGVGVAETLARFKNPAVQALVKDSLESTPEGAQYLNKLADLTDEQAVNRLAKLAGGKAQADVRAATESAKENLNAITGPMRESSLARANLGKYVADDAAVREANDLAVLMGSGSEIDPTRFVAQATGAEKALRSVGVKPLEGQSLIQRIANVAQSPQFAGNDLIEGSVKQIADDIAKWTSGGGVIDANALEAIRKNSVNAAIAKLRPGMDATSQRNAAAGVLSRVKPMIDNAIESAGGEGWRNYLTTHAKGMQKIAEKQLTGEAFDLYKKNKDAFVRLVQNESPDVVEKFLGPGKYNIATELADNTMGVLREEASRHLDRLAASKQATEGQKALATLVSQNTSMIRLPSFINVWAAAGNKSISELERRMGTKTTKILSEAMRSPQTAANLIESLPLSERSKVLQILNNPSKLGEKAAAITRAVSVPTNTLAPQSDSRNALAPR